jgi:hypothetical protein
MRRRLFAVVSALLAMSSIGLWIASNRFLLRIEHVFELPTPAEDGDFIESRLFSISVQNGCLEFLYRGHLGMVWHRPGSGELVVARDVNAKSGFGRSGVSPLSGEERRPLVETLHGHWLWFGPRRIKEGFNNVVNMTIVVVPIWACTALLGIPFLASFGRRRRSYESSACGYNLTGNTSGVCPECGTAVAQKVGVVRT